MCVTVSRSIQCIPVCVHLLKKNVSMLWLKVYKVETHNNCDWSARAACVSSNMFLMPVEIVASEDKIKPVQERLSELLLLSDIRQILWPFLLQTFCFYNRVN